MGEGNGPLPFWESAGVGAGTGPDLSPDLSPHRTRYADSVNGWNKLNVGLLVIRLI